MKRDGFTDASPGALRSIGAGELAFLPNPLPPPRLALESVMTELGEAMQAIGRLQGRGKDLPNPYLLIHPLRQSEALASSRMEGTIADPQDLAVAATLPQSEAPDASRDDGSTKEVLNYRIALDEAMGMLSDMPVTHSMIRGIHKRLLSGLSVARGANKSPGEYRKEQCHIGYEKNIRFTPPPALEAELAMNDLVQYIREENSSIPPLIDAALIHYQFEVIHPFADGNGRVGRILIPVFLATRGVLDKELPLFYPSMVFEKHRQEYLDRLLEVSHSGDWSGWIGFFLRVAQESCRETLLLVERIFALLEEYKQRLDGKRQMQNSIRLAEHLFQEPAVSIPRVADLCGVTYPSARRIVEHLAAAGILQELPHSRPKLFLAPEIIRLASTAL